MPMPGPIELVIIVFIILLVIGPGRLPDVASAVGKSIREFRRASSDEDTVGPSRDSARPDGDVASSP